MARIRTIKPEFPESETIGKLSRDARLLFILLWTVADDSGRARGNVAYLSGALFPYDQDARSLLDGWLKELSDTGCIRRYEVDGKQYLDIPSFLKHQRIDKPSPTRLPAFEEASKNTPGVIQEASPTDLVPSTSNGPRSEEPRAREAIRICTKLRSLVSDESKILGWAWGDVSALLDAGYTENEIVGAVEKKLATGKIPGNLRYFEPGLREGRLPRAPPAPEKSEAMKRWEAEANARNRSTN